MKLIQRNIAQIVALCEKHKVESLYVFGSVLTERFNDESDIDFVVVFDKAKVEDYFDNYFLCTRRVILSSVSAYQSIPGQFPNASRRSGHQTGAFFLSVCS